METNIRIRKYTVEFVPSKKKEKLLNEKYSVNRGCVGTKRKIDNQPYIFLSLFMDTSM